MSGTTVKFQTIFFVLEQLERERSAAFLKLRTSTVCAHIPVY